MNDSGRSKKFLAPSLLLCILIYGILFPINYSLTKAFVQKGLLQFMALRIDRDLDRFHKIRKGKVRQNLRKYIAHGEMIGKKGKDLVSIPIPSLDLPHFKHGNNGSGGVGQGEGDVGDQIGQAGDDGSGKGKGSSESGNHVMEVEVSLDELATMLGQELELPDIEPKGSASIESESINKVTPFHGQLNTRVHPARTFKQALKRYLASGGNPQDLSGLQIQKPDKWNKNFEQIPKPQANGRVIYMMDVSGSMTDDQKQTVRTEAWWISLWLRKAYPGLKEGYIIHDASAQVVDEEAFYHTKESGGTKISSAYGLCADVIEGKRQLYDETINAADENIYVIHFSDGDNYGDDDKTATDIVAERILQKANMFAYVQVKSPYGSGDFIRRIKDAFNDHQKVRTSEVEGKDGIPNSIKDIFGKGSKVTIAV